MCNKVRPMVTMRDNGLPLAQALPLALALPFPLAVTLTSRGTSSLM